MKMALDNKIIDDFYSINCIKFIRKKDIFIIIIIFILEDC